MRYLRTSVYAEPYDPPLTTVMSEADATDTLESVRLQLMTPGLYMVFDIFENEGDTEDATREAVQRQIENAEQEAHQAMLYHWTLLQWKLVRPSGLLMMDRPMPLSREEICIVYEQLAQHPDYRNIIIVSHDRAGRRVVMRNGTIEEDSDR